MSMQERSKLPNAHPDTRDMVSESMGAREFGYDPRLIYTRPVDGQRYPVGQHDIVVAVRKEDAKIYHQPHRDEEAKASYLDSRLSPGHYQSQVGRDPHFDVTGADGQRETIVPEVPIHTNKINPDLFVPHNQLPRELRG